MDDSTTPRAEPEDMALADRLKEALEEASLSQMDLSRRTGIHKATINAWYQGRSKKMTSEYAVVVAKALGVTADWLVSNKKPKRPDGSDGQTMTAGAADKKDWKPEPIDFDTLHNLLRALRAFNTEYRRGWDDADCLRRACLLYAHTDGPVDADGARELLQKFTLLF